MNMPVQDWQWAEYERQRQLATANGYQPGLQQQQQGWLAQDLGQGVGVLNNAGQYVNLCNVANASSAYTITYSS